MGDIIAREHIGLQVFAFCVVNVSNNIQGSKEILGVKFKDVICS